MNPLENALQQGINKLTGIVVNTGGHAMHKFEVIFGPESPIYTKGIFGATVNQLKFLHGRGFDDMSLAQKLREKGLEAEVDETNRRLKKEGRLTLDNLFAAGKWFVPAYGDDVTLLVAADGYFETRGRYYFSIDIFVAGDPGFSWKEVKNFLNESRAIVSNG